VYQYQVIRTKGQAMPVSKLRVVPSSQPPAGKNPHPFSSARYACRSAGLAQFFCLPPHNPRCCCFFCHTFCNRPTIGTLLFSFLKKINKPTHPQAKKKSGTPTATTVPEMRQKKTTRSYCT